MSDVTQLKSRRKSSVCQVDKPQKDKAEHVEKGRRKYILSDENTKR